MDKNLTLFVPCENISSVDETKTAPTKGNSYLFRDFSGKKYLNLYFEKKGLL